MFRAQSKSSVQEGAFLFLKEPKANRMSTRSPTGVRRIHIVAVAKSEVSLRTSFVASMGCRADLNRYLLNSVIVAHLRGDIVYRRVLSVRAVATQRLPEHGDSNIQAQDEYRQELPPADSPPQKHR